MSSVLRFDEWQDSDGNTVYDGSAFGPIGGILQVVSTTKADTFTSTSATFTEVTGLTASITPSSTSSKILVIATVLGNYSSLDTEAGQFSVFKGTNNLIVPTNPGSRTPSFVGGVTITHKNSGFSMHTYGFHILDAPNSVASLTYAVRGRIAGDATLFVNRSSDDPAQSASPRGVSTITLMEVAG